MHAVCTDSRRPFPGVDHTPRISTGLTLAGDATEGSLCVGCHYRQDVGYHYDKYALLLSILSDSSAANCAHESASYSRVLVRGSVTPLLLVTTDSRARKRLCAMSNKAWKVVDLCRKKMKRSP
jgi:hypothetical protein